MSPSSAVAGPLRVTLGLRLAMLTEIESLPVSLPSKALAETVELSGPSGKLQSKLVAVVFDLVPSVPQSSVQTSGESSPGSVAE